MQKKISILGAGRSSSTLIKYLAERTESLNCQLIVADYDLNLAESKVAAYKQAKAVQLDIKNKAALDKLIQSSDIVVSMMPAIFHPLVAESCIQFSKHMLTASYVDKEIGGMDEAAQMAGILILKECGLDPGIDHMTAMQSINHIKEQGGTITSFKSFTGGLVAPEFDNNPWNYKFTWNPKNVVNAGKGMCTYLRNGKYKYVPYHQLFDRLEKVQFDEVGEFEAYPNRDSLSYRAVYGLENIPTIFRGTLRRPGFCTAWSIFVHLGATDDEVLIEDVENMTYREFINSFLVYDPIAKVEDKLCKYVNISRESDVFKKLEWLGIFENKNIGLKQATAAQVLQHLLEDKWKLDKDDRDMIVMQHQFEYELNGEQYKLTSSLITKGDDHIHTAMSKTVGLPLAIAVKLLVTGKLKARGVRLPISQEIYEPILEELSQFGVSIREKVVKIP